MSQAELLENRGKEKLCICVGSAKPHGGTGSGGPEIRQNFVQHLGPLDKHLSFVSKFNRVATPSDNQRLADKRFKSLHLERDR